MGTLEGKDSELGSEAGGRVRHATLLECVCHGHGETDALERVALLQLAVSGDDRFDLGPEVAPVGREGSRGGVEGRGDRLQWRGSARAAAIPSARSAVTAQLMGIDRILPGMRIWVGPGGMDGQWFYVTGILNPATYAPEIDSAVLVGFSAAEKYLHFDGHPSEIYARSHHETVVIPTQAWPAVAAAVIIGALAGLLPAIRAARMSPTQALWTV